MRVVVALLAVVTIWCAAFSADAAVVGWVKVPTPAPLVVPTCVKHPSFVHVVYGPNGCIQRVNAATNVWHR